MKRTIIMLLLLSGNAFGVSDAELECLDFCKVRPGTMGYVFDEPSHCRCVTDPNAYWEATETKEHREEFEEMNV